MVNDIDNAVLFYSKAIEILDSEGDYNHSPGFASYLIEYAEILKEKKEYQKSLECFFKVRKIFKDHWLNEESPDAFKLLEEKIIKLQKILK